MTNQELEIRKKVVKEATQALLWECGNKDTEDAHYKADKILCNLLKDLGLNEVVDVYDKIEKWYS